jgi:pimeloyl-ACP methyl ester carboxylesterase
MSRLRIAFALLLFVFASLGGGTAIAKPIDQAAWSSLKKEVRLPNGVKLAYVELGNPKGAPVLLLHGYTDSSRTWSLIAPYLEDHRLLIPDQRGHGAADAPTCCYSLSNYADDARLFLDALGVRRAAVAGHSMGSMVAITMAAEYPERVSKVVLIGATALAPVKPGEWLYDQVAALKAPLDPGSQFMRDWHPGNQPTPVDAAFAKAAMDEVLAVPLHVWRAVMRELAYVPVGRHARDVKAPVLILSGGKDPLFPAEHHASLLKAFPGAEGHVFRALGHNPLWEKPTELGAIMERFLAEPDE